jgi:hypothetical protein
MSKKRFVMFALAMVLACTAVACKEETTTSRDGAADTSEMAKADNDAQTPDDAQAQAKAAPAEAAPTPAPDADDKQASDAPAADETAKADQASAARDVAEDTAAQAAKAEPAQADDANAVNLPAEFNEFCKSHFGAAHEPLVYETFGKELKLDDNGTWQHVSENSATLAFTTNIPAVSHVELTADGQDAIKTLATERAFYNHIHQLGGLKSGTTYNYKFIAVDEKGNQATLATGKITPTKIENAIYLPGDLKGAPYNLNKSGATYVLTKDIVADAVAFNIMAADITLDLNGHTITYDNVKGADLGPEKGFGHFGEQGPHAIRSSYGGKNSTIVNGQIVQGAGGASGSSEPVYRAHKLAGLSIVYHGPQLSAMKQVGNIEHCVVTDMGSGIENRHMGISAIIGNSKVSYNLIKRARHRGIGIGDNGTVNGNEVYIDSHDTNSYAVLVYKNKKVTVSNNKLFGTGYHVLGVGTVSAGVADCKITGNFIHLHAVAPLKRSSEYGPQSEAECVRVTWGGENILYEDNVMVARADAGGEASGIWHYSQAEGQKDVIYRNNVVKVLRADDRATEKLEGAIRICGESKNAEKLVPVLLEGNRVISNFCNVRIGDSYGTGSNARFVDNTFVKVGDQANYATIVIGHNEATTVGHVFKGTKFKGGAGFDKVTWRGSGRREFTVVDDEGNEKLHN